MAGGVVPADPTFRLAAGLFVPEEIGTTPLSGTMLLVGLGLAVGAVELPLGGTIFPPCTVIVLPSLVL
jgi:hypothetical protein